MWQNEQVMVVRDEHVRPLLNGVYTRGAASILPRLLPKHEFHPRRLMETDPSFRQLIPYILVRHGANYLLTRRSAKQDEARLRDKYSLGIGGHVNESDRDQRPDDPLAAGFMRELAEELHIGGPYEVRMDGIINDQSSEVSRVHLGIVYVLESSTPDCGVVEKELATSRWASVAELRASRDVMETWSQIVVDHVIPPS